MGDITGTEATEATRLVGSQTDGTEETPIGSNTNRELFTYDVANNGGEDDIITIPAGSVVQLKLGAENRLNRKYIVIQAKDKLMSWGFTPLTQSFDCFKSQFFILPFGPNTTVYIKNSGVNDGEIAIGEAS